VKYWFRLWEVFGRKWFKESKRRVGGRKTRIGSAPNRQRINDREGAECVGLEYDFGKERKCDDRLTHDSDQ